jgi:serine-type D-Ala-D-Ala carboxypeptidase (penicillin-binding protein 5/6)
VLKKTILVFVVVICFMMNLMMSAVAAPKANNPELYDALAVTKIMNKTNVFEMKAKSSLLMDATTGNVLMETNSHEKLPIASVTKVMSMLLVMEAVDSGKISLEDKVRVSDYAASMGGSQAYLKTGEEFTVHEMMKALAVHSSNDVTVTLAELISGSEDSFVAAMNEKAKELGMNNTNFLDCTGLTDDGHYSSANDIALMSRELVVKHPKILEYTSIWHDTFRDGTFDLDNTNKLVHFYNGCDGLKTGFTNKSGHCLSATAKRNDLRLISVVLGEPDSNTRFAETRKLLDYGFANFELTQVDTRGTEIGSVEVKKGITSKVNAVYGEDARLLLGKGEKGKIEREVRLEASLTAPIKSGQKVGEVIYKIGGNEVGKTDAVAGSDIDQASFFRLFFQMVMKWFGVGRV